MRHLPIFTGMLLASTAVLPAAAIAAEVDGSAATGDKTKAATTSGPGTSMTTTARRAPRPAGALGHLQDPPMKGPSCA